MKKHTAKYNKSKKRASASSMRLALENRLLFDGAVVATAAQAMDDKATQDQAHEAYKDVKPDVGDVGTTDTGDDHITFGNSIDAKNQDVQHTAAAFSMSAGDKQAPNLLVIDSRAEGVLELLTNPPKNTEVRVIDANKDGYQQIRDILHERGNTTQLHIQSAVINGKQWLGNSRLTGNLNATDMEAMIDWGDGLTANANISFHGRQTLTGQSWLHQVQALTGGQVRWSNDDAFESVKANVTEKLVVKEAAHKDTHHDKDKVPLVVPSTTPMRLPHWCLSIRA
jgi:hypothetical protein